MVSDARFVLFVAALVTLAGATSYWIAVTGDASYRTSLPAFGSYDEMARFLERSGSLAGRYGFLDPLAGGDVALAETGAVPYTGTNVQVEGVDEMDIVKTDGTYLYVAAPDNVTILRAYPPEAMAVVARIPAADLAVDGGMPTRIAGLFLVADRLVVVASSYGETPVLLEPGPQDVALWFPQPARTTLSVFDLTRREAPSLLYAVGVSGSPLAARATAGHVYLVASDPVRRVNDTYALPEVCDGAGCEPVDVRAIRYDPETKGANAFANVLAVDVAGGASEVLSVVTGFASTLYMSREALYLTLPKWEAETPFLALPAASHEAVTVRTTIYTIRAEGTDLEVVAHADVPGRLLNQFSLDEYEGYLRVATTTDATGGESGRNNLYVLDGDLAVVGRLEGLAPGERIHSARFLGDRAYLVTFRKVDPFFVLDLADPRNPTVLGFLKIPGYSDYLHPVDEGYILGVGKDAVPAEDGDFAWFQGLKLSLFDVADVARPKEVAQYLLGDRGTDSEVLRDHKAFLYLPSARLLVLPVSLYEVNESAYPDGPPPNAYGEFVWLGAYVLSVTPEDGFVLRGRIAHTDGFTDLAGEGYRAWPYAILRSLSIGDYLYTVSPTAVKANALADLAEANALVYAAPPDPETKG
jgi:uncharacterized secreted protein with C-terminal beta-propeller domain